MAIDSRSKRASVLGVGRPWMVSKQPDASKDEAWRIASGNAYSGNLLAPAPSGIDSREKRACIPGVGRPWLRGKLPNAAKNEPWRLATGNAYCGNLLETVVRLSFGKRVRTPIRGLRVREPIRGLRVEVFE